MPPKLPPHLVRSKAIRVVLTPREHDILMKLAAHRHQYASDMIRTMVREAARRVGITSEIK